jgi:hypothetical protein
LSDHNETLTEALSPISEADSLVRSAISANAETQTAHAKQAVEALKAAAKVLGRVK